MASDVKDDEGEDIERIEYSWYYLAGPLLLLAFTTKCCNPNILTSVAMVFVAMCAIWFYQDDVFFEAA